jgi:hypothetical protein
LLTKSAELTEKNVDLVILAQALALIESDIHDQFTHKNDFPVPGGPYIKIAFHGFRFPTKSCGYFCGKIIASSRAFFASSKPTTSSHFMFGFSFTIASNR